MDGTNMPPLDSGQRAVPGDLNLPLAMAYVPMQLWETPYALDVGLARGTIFPSLDLPFVGRRGA